MRQILGLCPPARDWARGLRALWRGRRNGADCFLWFAAPGHFYSPLPVLSEALACISRERHPGDGLPGLDLRLGPQQGLWASLLPCLRRVVLARDPDGGRRYHAGNPFFCEGEAMVAAALLQTLRPQRVVEIGCGWSSALLLDADEAVGGATQFCFIDPDHERLAALVRPGDRDRHRLIQGMVQEQPASLFESLGAGDWLFIDSSHVGKVGSDVLYLIMEILPRLRPGVLVHIHDIYWPFEYPAEWYREGRAWNEAYYVRAMLQHSSAWRILFWNDCFWKAHESEIRAEFPGLSSLGAGLWLERCGE